MILLLTDKAKNFINIIKILKIYFLTLNICPQGKYRKLTFPIFLLHSYQDIILVLLYFGLWYIILLFENFHQIMEHIKYNI